MDWTWDPRKAAANLGKPRISFDLAVLVFSDPRQLSRLDAAASEERWQTVARPLHSNPSVLLVVHTVLPGDVSGGRIISARKATRHERIAYENQTF